MAWAYCGCGQTFDIPTLAEAIKGSQVCPNCDEEREVDRDTLEMRVRELLERIETV